MNPAFRGLVGTPVTPFAPDGTVDFATVERLIDFLIQAGAHNIALPMHVGESLNMTLKERAELASVAVRAVGGRVPLIVNVGLSATAQVVELAKQAEKAGADAILVTPPYYWHPSPEGLLDHFSTIASAVELPFLAYRILHVEGDALTVDFIARLIQRCDTFTGMKDASNDMSYFTECCAVATSLRPSFSMFIGGEHLLPSMSAGGHGTFSPSAPIAPGLLLGLYSACLNKDDQRATVLQVRALRLLRVLMRNLHGSLKYAHELLGRPVGVPRLPLSPLTDEQKESLRRELELLGVLGSEPNGWTVPVKA